MESQNSRNVKGTLFKDYVRMIKRLKGVDWARHLKPEDMEYLEAVILPLQWYPLATFQRLGAAIFKEIARESPEASRQWGIMSMEGLAALYKNALIEKGDQLKTLSKFKILNLRLFDFSGFELELVGDKEVEIRISREFGNLAVQGYSYQMLGSFQKLLELSGAKNVRAEFKKKLWEGAENSVIVLRWME